MTGLERWLRDLLDAARLEVGGDDGGGDGGRRHGADMDVQREHLHVSLLISYGLPPKNQDKSNWGERGQNEATPENDGE